MGTQIAIGVRIFANQITKILVILVLITLPLIARADETAYMNNGAELFGIMDLNTGVFTETGNMGQLLSGIGVSGGNLYGGVFDGNTLYEINPANGSLTTIGNGSITYYDTGSTTTGLYALGLVGSGLTLYSINPATGAATTIGSTGLTQINTIGLSTASSVLYLDDNGTLYSLNTTTGLASQISTTGGTPEFGAMVLQDGTLYGGANNTPSAGESKVYTINPSNGNSTFVANTSGGAGNFWGLAPTPEPETMLLFGTGLLMIGWKLKALKERRR